MNTKPYFVGKHEKKEVVGVGRHFLTDQLRLFGKEGKKEGAAKMPATLLVAYSSQMRLIHIWK